MSRNADASGAPARYWTFFRRVSSLLAVAVAASVLTCPFVIAQVKPKDSKNNVASSQDQSKPKPASGEPSAKQSTDTKAEVAGPKTPPVGKSIDLLATDLAKKWELFSSREETELGDVWKLVTIDKERVLICTGDPPGFLRTQANYQDFELKFEWKYPTDQNGNSGVLVFTLDEPRLWPTSMQIQLHQPRAGCIFFTSDAKSDNTSEATGLAHEVGKWNKCRIKARDGRISVEINDKPAGEVTGCDPSHGFIAIQSEGSETHFRRMRLTILSPTSESTTKSARANPNDKSGDKVNDNKKPST